jgi:uncharacterized protein with HEPN domain
VSRSDAERIQDILDAAGELAAVTDAGRDAFLRSPVHQRAAERLLEIIGEASIGLSAATREAHAAVAWRDIARLRNLLAHHYHRIDPAQVWAIATTEVPALAHALAARPPS